MMEKFLAKLKAQAELDAHNTVAQPTIGELEKAMVKKALAGGKTTFTKDELESPVKLKKLFGDLKPGPIMSADDEPYLTAMHPGVLGPNSIEQQVADGVFKAMSSIPKEDPGTIWTTMKQLHDLGFYVTSATTHLGAGNIPEIVVTWQQPDADKLLGMLEYLTKAKHQ